MEISIALQTLVFLKAVLLGAALGLLYDLLRAIRRTLHAGIGATAFFDSLFWVSVIISLFVFVLAASSGEGRAYILIGCGLGGALYLLTCSPPLLALLCFLLEIFIKIADSLRLSLKRIIGFIRGMQNTECAPRKIKKYLKNPFLFFRKWFKI